MGKNLNKLKKFILFIFFPALLIGQNQSLTYSSYLELILANNPIAAAANNTGLIGRNSILAAKGNFDPFINANLQNKQLDGKSYYTVGKAELKQPIFTSHSIKAGYEYGQGNFINPENKTPSYGLPYLGVEASLLQGLTFDKKRSELIKARYYNDYYNSEKAIALNNFLYAGSQAYMNLLYARKVIDLNRFFTRLALERKNGIEELANVGERAAVDTIEASIFLQTRMLDLQASEIDLIKTGNDLLFFEPQLQKETLASGIRDSIDSYFNSAISFFNKWLINDSLTNPYIKQYQAKQGLLETDLRLKREMLKPKLDLSYNFLSGQDIPNNFSTNNYKWGATVSFPLFFRGPRGEYKIAKLLTNNNALEFSNQKNLLNNKRRILAESGRVILQQIQNAQRSAQYSKQLVDAERMKFTNGESSLFLVNTRESKWLETELKLMDYKLKFIKTVLEAVYIDGSLNYNI